MAEENTADKITIDFSKIKTAFKAKKPNCKLFDFLKYLILGAVVFLVISQLYYTIKLYESILALKDVESAHLKIAQADEQSKKEERIFLFVEKRGSKYSELLMRHEPIGKQLEIRYNLWRLDQISFHGKVISNNLSPSQIGLMSGDTIKIE